MARDKSVIIRIEGNSKALRDEFERVKKSTENLEKDLKNIAKGSGIAFAGLATTVGLTVKSFATYETGLIGVGKTADLTGKDLTDFGKRIQKLSTEIPFATNQLLEIAQAAGQLGVKGSENLLKFTETIAKLSTASDLKGEEAATVLTRILNITREGTDDIDKFASVIVALGNSFAASESQIAAVTTRVARATTQFGVSSAEAAAFGAALKAVGIEAEGGGSAVGRAFQAIDASLKKGGEGFVELQRLTGLTGSELKKTFETDSTRVFQLFIEGLGRAGKTTKDVTERLNALGLSGTEILSVLPVLATSSDELSRALNIAGRELKENTALSKEYAAQSNTLDNETKKLANTVGVLSEQIGKVFSPSVKNALTSVKELLASFLGLEEGTKKNIATILGITTAFFGLVAVIATLGIGVLGLKAGFGALAVVFAGIAAPVGALAIGLGTVGFAIAAVVTNLEAFRALWIAVQAGVEMAKDNFVINVNKMRIAFNELVIAAKEARIAILEAFPGELLKQRIEGYKKGVETLLEENAKLAADNANVKQSFEEIYDSIDAERMREKLLQEGQAAREAREENKIAEFERQGKENEEKLIQEQEYKNLLQEQNITAQEAVNALKTLELQLLEAQQKKFNNAEIVNLKKQIADKKKILTKGFTEEQKQTFKHLEDVQKAEIQDNKDRLEFKKTFLNDILSSVISSGKSLFKEGTGAAKALFVVEQAAAFANNIVNTQTAAAKAAAATAPFSAPFVAAEYAAGALRAAAITGATISGLEQGGMVGSAGASRSGDRHPAMLADGELVVPRKNFEEVVAATARQRGFSSSEGGGFDEANANPTRIEISFTDDAAEIITARQLENSTLGTDRG